MRNLKNLNKNLLSFILIGFFSLSLSPVFGQEEENKEFTKKESMDSDNLKKDIQSIHAYIGKMIEKLGLEKNDVTKIPMGLGLNTSMGARKRYVYEEYATIESSGSSLSKIEFFYTQTGEKSLYKESRRMINEDPGDDKFEKLIFVYKSSGNSDKRILYKDIKSVQKQYKTLINYRNTLNRLVRLLEYHLDNVTRKQSADIEKVLSVGDAMEQ